MTSFSNAYKINPAYSIARAVRDRQSIWRYCGPWMADTGDPDNSNLPFTQSGNVYMELDVIPYAISIGPHSTYADLLVYYEAPTSGDQILASGNNVTYIPGAGMGSQIPADPSLGSFQQYGQTATRQDAQGNSYLGLVTPTFTDGYGTYQITPQAPMVFNGWPLRAPQDPVSTTYNSEYNYVPANGKIIISTYPTQSPAAWLGVLESEDGTPNAARYRGNTDDPPESILDVIVYLRPPAGGIPMKRPNRRWKILSSLNYNFKGTGAVKRRYVPVQYRRGWRATGRVFINSGLVGSQTVVAQVYGVKTPVDITYNPMYVALNTPIGTTEQLLYEESFTFSGNNNAPQIDIGFEPNGYDWICFKATGASDTAYWEGWVEAWD